MRSSPTGPRRRRLRKTRPRGAAGRAGRGEVVAVGKGTLEAHAGLEPGEIHAEAHMGPWAIRPGVRRSHAAGRTVGLGEHGGVAIGTRERDGDEVPLSDGHARKLGVARHVRSTTAPAGSRRTTPRPLLAAGPLGSTSACCDRGREQVRDAFTIIAFAHHLEIPGAEHHSVRRHLRPSQPTGVRSGGDER